MPVCAHKGCGKSFDDISNSDNACQYHPGAPVFHEGLKGWGCCKKRVTEFDEFLKIPGCTEGKHAEKLATPPPEPTLSNKTSQSRESKLTSAPSLSKTTATGVEHYSSSNLSSATANLSLNQKPPTSSPSKGSKSAAKIVELPTEDPADAIIPPKTTCKRKACGYQFVSNDVSRGDGNEAKCVYHPGAPIFHEGSKGWSCCSRRVLEFDEFLKIQGCKTGRHVFLEPPKDPSAEELIQCRRDWYQTQSHVLLNVFAKKVDKNNSKIVFAEESIDIDLKMPDGKRYKDTIFTFQPIDPVASSFEFLSTKVEIKLKKGNGIAWANLEAVEGDVKSFTTFGTVGSNVGTIGGKEIYINKDAPIYAKR